MTTLERHLSRTMLSPMRAHHARFTAPTLVALSIATLLAIEATPLAEKHVGVVAPITLIAITIEFVVLCRSAQSSLGTLTGLFWMALVLFHFGLAIPISLELPLSLEFIRQTDCDYWLSSAYTGEALLLSLLGTCTFLLGSNFAKHVIGAWKTQAEGTNLHSSASLTSSVSSPTSVATREAQLLGGVGTILLAYGVFLWFGGTVTRGGIDILTSSYHSYRSATESAGFAFEYVAISVGVVFITASDRPIPKRLGITLFASFAAVVLPLGSRTVVLFPAVAVLWIRGRRNRPLSNRRVIGLLLTFMLASSAIREIRAVGLQNTNGEQLAATSALTGLAELGFTLRPVVECVRWRNEGESLLLGASYWAPIERAFAKFLPGFSRLPANEDMRLQANIVRARVGEIGFSPIAEAYRNFGTLGVCSILFGLGLILGSLDSTPTTALWLALSGVVFVPLLTHVRNEFTPVPAHICVGAVGVQLCAFLARLRR